MFHLFKQTKFYAGYPYCGPTSNYILAEYETLEEAKKMREKFQLRNPVGWNIYDSKTLELVDGFDFYK